MRMEVSEHGRAVTLHLLDGRRRVASIRTPLVVLATAGDLVDAPYSAATRSVNGVVAVARARSGSTTVEVFDTWSVVDGRLRLERDVKGFGASGGVQVRFVVELPAGAPRFLVPGMIYSPDQWADGERSTFADHRLAYPMVAAHDAQHGQVLVLARTETARLDAHWVRRRGQSVYLQPTDVGSVGFHAPSSPSEPAALEAAWPYTEGDRSAMLDARGTAATALYPLEEGHLGIHLSYVLDLRPATTYGDAARQVLEIALDLGRPVPSACAVPLEQTIDYRLDSAATTFQTTPTGFAGFVLNFDPERGYDSHAKAFGASFAEHRMATSHDILEYGFTGRQLNLAYMLARRDPQTWLARCEQVVASFVERMAQPSGWVHTLWDLARDQPVFACGDPSGPVMHYLGESPVAGTYTRMMVEAGGDLLLCLGLAATHGAERPAWRDCVRRLGDFLVGVQEPDGSWVRAYAPDGRAITAGSWFGGGGQPSKTATGTVIPYLLAAAIEVPDRAAAYRQAALRAGEYVLEHHVRADDYRGGTLDNPNLVDKEASFIAMRALLALHDLTGDEVWRTAAARAATVAATWHSLWDVPSLTGTPVAVAGTRSVGWGGINSVWGVGVTDIYSLFFLADLHRLGTALHREDLVRVAELAAYSSVGLLALPSDRHGFADVGMQPEGIAFCPQGVDDGLISKGDTWGGLGWPYTAGTFGLSTYLEERARLS